MGPRAPIDHKDTKVTKGENADLGHRAGVSHYEGLRSGQTCGIVDLGTPRSMRLRGPRMRIWAGLIVALATAFAAHATPPLEAYGRLPAIDYISLSPSGERFALVVRNGEKRQLSVYRTDGKVEFATGLEPGKVRDVQWGGDRHLFVLGSSTIDAPLDGWSRQEWMGGAHLDLKTGKAFPLFGNSNTFIHAFFGWYGVREIGGRSYAYLGGITQEETRTDVYYASSRTIFPKLVRIDLETAKADYVVRDVGESTEWLVGPSGEILVRGVTDAKGNVFRLFPGAGGAPIVVGNSIKGQSRLELVGPGRTRDKLLIWERSDDDVLLKEVSLATGGDGEVLIRGDNTAHGLFDRDTHALIGISSDSGADIKFFDPALQAKYDASNGAFPTVRSVMVSYGRGLDTMIFQTDGEGDSGTYWLVDVAKRSAVPIGRIYPDIKKDDVGSVEKIAYKAADGLEMDGILTLPPGREAKNLPLVVFPHGGPLVQGDEEVFDWWAQAFASRGYAVFQPNYRGTLGRGEDFRKAAFGEFGRKMQTDVTDGVKALAEKGIIDPKRACIMGASYGGYAALAGVTVEQGRYRCSVAVAGLSDLPRFQYWLRDRHGSNQQAVTFWKALTGAAGSQDLKAVSPATLAARADAPILLIHGEDDSVVPIEQSRMMESALNAAGKPVEFITMKGEDHWLSGEPTRQAMLAGAVAFVEKHNPAR